MANKADKRIKPEKKQNSTPPAPAEVIEAAAFPIVAIGASAGGLQAFTDLLGAIPEKPGFALVFVMHTDSRDSSLLRGVLARKSKMPVEIAADGAPITINRLYIPPPGTFVFIEEGHFRLQKRDRSSPALPIDACFRSLAEDHGNRAIAVVLSGTASDGTLGIKAIKAEGGITFAQDDSAQSLDMPHNAVLTGAIDFVMSPPDIARELVRIAQAPYMSSAAPATGIGDSDLSRVFQLLHMTHDVDFTHYKKSTLERRIRRRMTLHHLDTIDEYVSYVENKPSEVEALYNDILIRVTGFFRDPEVFDALCTEIVPQMLRDRVNEPLRVWVPGCATGEEVYSLAICMVEAVHDGGLACPVQIFGTDISDQSIDRARAGFYPAEIESEITPERLRRFFVRTDGGYRVTQSLRDCCIFARQNLTKDPPFSRLDLVSCRNVMIYLGTVLQRRVMSIFNYALRPNGFLLLGSSETIGNFAELFVSVDRRHKIYMKRNAPKAAALGFSMPARTEIAGRHRMEEDITAAAPNVFREADRVLLTRYSPPGVLINDQMDILQFRGRTSAFLEPAPGAATLNLFKMAREGLIGELRTAVHAARKKDTSVRREGIRVAANGSSIVANIEVIPFKPTTGEQCFVILFEEVPPEPKKGKTKSKKVEPEPESRHAQRLKRDLDATREYLQSIIEEQEAMNEELRSANEEIQSSNEELQSTNEELETAKEELQSSNEELTTLNEELENRNAELAEANNDLINLLASVEIPIVMLDAEMRIRRMNPGAQRTLNLIPTDVGRPIRDLKMTLRDNDIEPMIHSVIENLEVREARVQHQNGQWYSLRIRPYKTTENKIEGAVLVMVDVDAKR